MEPITFKEKVDYIKKGGYNNCPKCKSENITGGHIQADADYAWRVVDCENCTASWREVFTLTNIEDN